jgi:diphosphomevalonate decarboxylase
LASSASSFAALTRAAYDLARRHDSALSLPESELSRLSRRGSGSSCRSFFSPWALWREEGAEAASLDLKLEHAVVIVESRAKAVSSSLAHRRVETSLLYPGRAERASRRLAELLAALKAVAETADGADAWRAAMEICWSEFWDMHALFETSRPAFGYMTEESSRVLNRLREVWREEGDGPLITMDAGPNVHLLLRPEQTTAAGGWLRGLNSRRSWEAEG